MSVAGTAHVKLLLDSYKLFLKKEFIAREGENLDALHISNSHFVVLSHGREVDPILNYGNKRALKLWGMNWDEFTSTPSRCTAETINQNSRDKVLKEVSDLGCSKSYSGIRISKQGRRFLIKDAFLWNLIDAQGVFRGQAAAFRDFEYL